ncbi:MULTISPECIES: NADPH-dependent FMN reductase [unclassified Pseudomonas]|uniref:NADPH-dependent FMN reductase n=1 Tax=unclassified Pseudomonas TaxID=196821 RepID=UPI00069CEA92|nr:MULTISPECIES: NADPH-dependent FMN reductase [unclassified Pseudomonas]WPN44718.1 NADPH-dependent FMN reductase [Pseudomonas sp. P8_241]
MKNLQILGICGSLRHQSYNRSGLLAAAENMPSHMRMVEGSLRGIPVYDGDVEEQGIPAEVLRLAEEIRCADALLIASPEYNFSISGTLKNAIDWLSRTTPQPFKNKPVALLSVTPGPVGGARQQYELRKVLGCLEAIVLPRPEIFIGLCAQRFDAEGRLVDETTRGLLGAQMHAFNEWITQVTPRNR